MSTRLPRPFLLLRRFIRTFSYVSEVEENPGFSHPRAIVHPNDVIGQRVSIGPSCMGGSSAKLGNACQPYPGSHIFGDTEIGDRCIIMTLWCCCWYVLPGPTVFGCNIVVGHHAVVGLKCQDKKCNVGLVYRVHDGG